VALNGLFVPSSLDSGPERRARIRSETSSSLTDDARPTRRALISRMPLSSEEGTPLKGLNDIYLENGSSQGHNLALTVLCAPISLESGQADADRRTEDPPLERRACLSVSLSLSLSSLSLSLLSLFPPPPPLARRACAWCASSCSLLLSNLELGDTKVYEP